jgi:hypothetical protein
MLSTYKPEPVEFIFTFNGVTDAITGEKKLLDGGIPVMVMPAPHQLGPRCGICLRVHPGDRDRAREILGDAVKNIYAVTMEEDPSGSAGDAAEGAEPIIMESRKNFTLWNG